MDHSHRDRTYKKSRFQQELEQSVSRKLISSLLLGCLWLLGTGVPEHLEISVYEKIPNSRCSVFFPFVLQFEYYFCARSIKIGLSKGFR